MYVFNDNISIYTDNTVWLAIKSVYGDIKHLLCYWHVERCLEINYYWVLNYYSLIQHYLGLGKINYKQQIQKIN